MKLNIETNSQQLKQWQRTTKALPWLILAVGLALTYFAQQTASRVEHQAQQHDFDSQTREITLRIERRLTAYKQIMKGTAGLFEASKGVERDAFREYVARLRLSSSYPGIHGIGFSLLIPSQEKTRHIETIRKEVFPGYTIFPEGERGIYTSIVYMEPFTGRNLRTFGYDAFSDPMLRTGMEQARDLDQASISGKASLVQKTGQQEQAGVVMFMAVYHNNRPRTTTAERRANIFGWIYSPFHMDDLMFETLGERGKDIGLEIFDGENVTPESLIYETDKKPSLLKTSLSTYQTTVRLDIFANPWTIRMRSLPAFEERFDTGRVVIIGLTGTLLSLLLSLLIWQLVNGRARAIKLAQNMTLEWQESEYRWKFAIEGSGGGDGLWDWNVADNTLFFSKRWKEMLGYAEDEIGNSFDEWEKRIHPDDKALNSSAMQGYFDGKTPTYTCEYRFGCKDGSWKWILVRGMVVSRTKDAKPLRMIGTHSDITARKQAEEALHKAGALQRAIFNSANFSSIATDAEGVIQIFNVGAERMLGYVAADVMNKITPADISDPEEVIARAKALSVELETPIMPGFEALVFKASRGIEDIYELTYIRKDGSRFPAVVSVTALRDAQNAILGYLLIGTDNTVRKQIEAEQKQLDQRLLDQQFYMRSLIESNIDAIITTDLSGIITDVNKQMEVLTGCMRDELIGSPFKNYFTDPERAEAGIKLVLSNKKVTDYELTTRARDGKETVVSYNATSIYDRNRTLQGVFAAARDVTDRQIANDKLKLALNEKEMLLKEVYHRVKNNLQVVSSLLNLQAKNVKNEATLELLRQSADRIKAMALLHEKLYQSKDLARINFNEYIQSLVDHLLFSYDSHSDKIKISMRIDEVFFDVDTAIPCGLIINELLSNALQHAFPDDRHGEIGITFTQDQGEFILVIADNGISFPAGLDFKNSTSLGLQLVATLTNQLNGQITLNKTAGSTFTIRFTNTY